MKKFFTFALIFTLVFSLAACGKDDKPTETPENTTLGQTLLSVFRENSRSTPEQIANACLSSPAIEFMGSVMPVEEGALMGLDAEINGFSEGYMFAPNIGTIPFVGYVLDAGEKAPELVETLKKNANPRWNICTEAEETIVEEKDGKVFFLMCPKDLSTTDGDVSADENIAP
ncbi:MAG: hypothetical protein IKM21_02405 [Oscillospiraceae bacterium]|nr:hypothetical protein [Oscillospiraceae bacterium]